MLVYRVETRKIGKCSSFSPVCEPENYFPACFSSTISALHTEWSSLLVVYMCQSESESKLSMHHCPLYLFHLFLSRDIGRVSKSTLIIVVIFIFHQVGPADYMYSKDIGI
ncbi:hypothetical protein Dimus_004843 [Dionaea muscipula]